MTVQNTVPYEKYITNGSDAVYTLSYYVEDKDHLLIKLDDTVVSKNEYSYIKSSNAVQFNTTLSANQKLEIFRKTKLERTTNYESFNNTFRPEVLNNDLDKIWLNLQEQNFKVNQYDHDYEYAVHTATQALTQGVTAQARADQAYELADITNTETRPIERGGTGAYTAEDARTNLNVHSKEEVVSLIQSGGSGTIVAVNGGGTGADNIADARTNLDVYSKAESNFLALPLGTPIFHSGSRITIEAGYVPLDGQLLNRADYPAMWAKIQSTFALKTDAAWLADPKVRGCYSSGNGTTTFRMPDLNGTQSGSIKAPVMRGDGNGTVAGETKTIGQMDTDAIRNITGSVDAIRKHLGTDPISTGALKGTISATTGDANNGNAPTIKISMDASLVVPTAPENRMNSVYGVWICRVGDAATEISEPTLHAVLTGGNTFNGSQKVNGDLTIYGEIYHKGTQYLTKSRWKSYIGSRVFGTTYLNNTPYEKEVNVKSALGTSFLPSLKVTFTDLVTNESIVVYFGCSSNWSGGIYCAECFTVPPYTSYKAEVVRADTTTSIVTLNVLEWWERDYVA